MKCSSCKTGELESCFEKLTVDMDGESVTLDKVPIERCTECGTVFYEIGGTFEGDYSI